MLNIFIKTDSHYKINRDRVRRIIDKALTDKGVKGKIEVSLAVVGDRQMKILNKKYRNLDITCSVLTFPLTNENYDKSPFIDPPDKVLRLGDIVISYPQTVVMASEENKMIDDKVDDLIQHGLLHLLGQLED